MAGEGDFNIHNLHTLFNKEQAENISSTFGQSLTALRLLRAKLIPQMQPYIINRATTIKLFPDTELDTITKIITEASSNFFSLQKGYAISAPVANTVIESYESQIMPYSRHNNNTLLTYMLPQLISNYSEIAQSDPTHTTISELFGKAGALYYYSGGPTLGSLQGIPVKKPIKMTAVLSTGAILSGILCKIMQDNFNINVVPEIIITGANSKTAAMSESGFKSKAQILIFDDVLTGHNATQASVYHLINKAYGTNRILNPLY